jgi:hypothetical protein
LRHSCCTTGKKTPDRAEDFRKIRPDFQYLEIPQASAAVSGEKPEEVANALLSFAKW